MVLPWVAVSVTTVWCGCRQESPPLLSQEASARQKMRMRLNGPHKERVAGCRKTIVVRLWGDVLVGQS